MLPMQDALESILQKTLTLLYTHYQQQLLPPLKPPTVMPYLSLGSQQTLPLPLPELPLTRSHTEMNTTHQA